MGTNATVREVRRLLEKNEEKVNQVERTAMSIKTKTIKAEQLKPEDLIVQWIDDKAKKIEVFPVWNVTWCDCWETSKNANANRKKYAGYKKVGQKKVRYDAMLGLETEIDYPHFFYCNKAYDGKYSRLSKVHIKVGAFNIEMMGDIGGRAYNKSQKVEILVDSSDYNVTTEMGEYFYKDMVEVIKEWQPYAEQKAQARFDDGQYGLDVEDFTSEELLAIVVKDAMSYKFWLAETPANQCTACWHQFGNKGLKPEDTAKKVTLDSMLLSAVELWGRWIPLSEHAELETLYNKLLDKARKGRLSRLEYMQAFNGKDIELV